MRQRVILVHDNPTLLDGAETAPETAGYEVAGFTDPSLALRALDQRRSAELLITRANFRSGGL